ncbi:hypothetical protein OH77DRAFT_1584380 [Trametes cingulata]|nr:hypothetical protein OH77DRAFT_1584380 [Trametes cingulata]
MVAPQPNPSTSRTADGARSPARAPESSDFRVPALWPWAWDNDRRTIAHPQGCAICDAYLAHLDLEREMGIRSLQEAHHQQEVALIGEARRQGYTAGIQDGRAEGALPRFDIDADNARLRAELRALRAQHERLDQRLARYRQAYGALQEDTDTWQSWSDSDGDEYIEESRSRGRKKGKQPAGPTPEERRALLRSFFAPDSQRWREHVEDIRRLRTATRPPASQALPPPVTASSLLGPPDDPGRMPPMDPAEYHLLRGESYRSLSPQPVAPARDLRRIDTTPPPHVPRRRGRSPDAHHYRRSRSYSYDRSRSRSRTRQRRRHSSRCDCDDCHYGTRRSSRRGYSPSPRGRGDHHASSHSRRDSFSRAASPHFPPPTGALPYAPPRYAAQGGRSGPTPAYGDAAYGFAPHYNPTMAFVDHFAPVATVGAPSIPVRATTTTRAPIAQPAHPTMAPTATRTSQGGGAGHVPLFRYTAANAPPLPASIEEVRQLKVAAEMENTQGMRAIAALRWWISQRQSKGYQPNDIEKEVLRFRLPTWFKEKYEPKRHAKDEQRARGQLLAEPRPTDPTEVWVRYLNERPRLLSRHVRRDARGRVDESMVHGYVHANRMASIQVADQTVRRNTRSSLFELLATLFRDMDAYADHVQRLGCPVAPRYNPVAYNGPVPPTLDDVVRHAAQCGVSTVTLPPAARRWAEFHSLSLAPVAAAQPVPVPPSQGTTEAQAPAEATDGLGAATPGGVLPNTTQAEPSNDGPTDVPITEDVPMEDDNPEV